MPVLRALLLPLFLVLFAACTAEPPRVRLAPPEPLIALLPDSVLTYGTLRDTTYRGYYEDSTGTMAVLTTQRLLRSAAALASISLTSTTNPDRFAQRLVATGGRLLPDSIVAMDSTLAPAIARGWHLYDFSNGIVLVDGTGNVVEARSTFPGFAQIALATIDLDRFVAVPEVEMEVDGTFARAIPGDEPEAAPDSATVRG
jgi:hypothetical protein